VSETIEYYDNIIQRTINLLLEQFRNKEAFNLFVEVLTEQYQELESVFKQIEDLTWLYTSTGVQLDRLGDIIGYRRGSRDDEEYRDFLNFGILLNRSAGEPEFLILGLIKLTRATFVQLYEFFPAACAGHTNGQELPINITAFMDDLALGGVKFLYVSQTDGVPFSFASETSETDGLGYAWIDGTGFPNEEDAGEYPWALPT